MKPAGLHYCFYFFLLLILSCSENTGKSPVDSAKTDTSKTGTTKATTILQPLKEDTFLLINKLVASIREKIKNNELTRIGEDDGEDADGGYVYGYFYPDRSIAYLYSSSSGGEFGRDETESFFRNDTLLFSIYRYYYFLNDTTGEVTSSISKLKAKKIFYFPGGKFSRDSITVFENDKEFPGRGYVIFRKKDFPEPDEFTQRITKIKSNLLKWGK